MSQQLKFLSSYVLLVSSILVILLSSFSQPSFFIPSSAQNNPFFDLQMYISGLNYAATHPTPFAQAPQILIIPHHLLASYIIADLLSKSAHFSYSHIVLIGPNHHELGDRQFQVTTTPNLTPIFTNEHSIRATLPYINYYFPSTPVTSIILKHDATLTDIQSWTTDLSQFKPQSTLFIFSLDFSHYLPANVAQTKDQITYTYILHPSPSQILKLNNDFVDNPSGLALSLSLAQNLKATSFILVHHTNSGLLLQNFSQPTTSYFGLAFFPNHTSKNSPLK